MNSTVIPDTHKTIDITPPKRSWRIFGEIALQQLRAGHTEFAIGYIPLMVEKLDRLEALTDADNKLSVNTPIESEA